MTEDIRHIVDTLAAEVARSIVVVTPEIRVITHSAHLGDEDTVRVRGILQRQAEPAAIEHIKAQRVSTWSESGFIPSNDDIGMKRRSCTPVRWQGQLLGYLMMIDEACTLTTRELERAEHAAAAIAVILSGIAQKQAGQQEAKENWLADLLAPEKETAQRAARAAPDGVPVAASSPVQVVVVETVAGHAMSTPEADALMRAALTAVAAMTGSALCAYLSRDGQGVMLLALAQSSTKVELTAQRVIDRLTGHADVKRAVVGYAHGPDGLTDASVAYERAVTAARGALVLEDRADIVDWDDLGVYSVLLDMSARTLQRLVPGGIHALKAADPSGVLLQTAEVYLDVAASPPAAATTLHVHRTTLYYRLGRIRELSGLNLADGNDRLTFHLGLRALRVLEASVGPTAL
ncbi:PucR family transcriptional regulator [Kribbella capetownensis]|nr:helix-turn-helix domain-containing protein [Kribbella capetownensis]